MPIASDADNIRYNGTGIAYAATVASANPGADLGELEGFSFTQAVTKEQIKSTRNAARGTILEATKETDATLKFGLREQTNTNLAMILMASSVASDNQAAADTYQTTKTWVADEYVTLGSMNVFSTKISHGTVTDGPFVVGDTVAQTTPDAGGKVAYVGDGFVELIDVSGVWTVGDSITSSAKTATITGIDVQQDVIITSSDGATRRAQGTDYSIEPKAGYVRKLTGGALADADKVSFDCEALTRSVMYGLSSNSVQKKLTFVTDADDYGPRKRYTFHKVQISTEGEMQLLGDGIEVLSCSGTVIRDTTQPAGQEYYKVEVIT